MFLSLGPSLLCQHLVLLQQAAEKQQEEEEAYNENSLQLGDGNPLAVGTGNLFSVVDTGKCVSGHKHTQTHKSAFD